jgi:SAM-dependent methyltransferase
MSNILITDENYWNDKYLLDKIGWDIGYVSTPIKEYFDQLTDKTLQILIPGCGNAWEGEYAINNGFRNTHLIDLSTDAISKFKKRVPNFPKSQIYHGDFFEHNKKYDLIIEQTFLSALHPTMRKEYAQQMAFLLKPGAKLIGVIFGIDLYHDHPPYGGHIEDYKELFDPFFIFHTFETANNSIPPRAGSEIFMILEKK